MAFDDLLAEREPDTGSVLRCVYALKRMKDEIVIPLVDSGAVVGNFKDVTAFAVHPAGYSDLGRLFRIPVFDGILDKVHKQLPQQAWGAPHGR